MRRLIIIFIALAVAFVAAFVVYVTLSWRSTEVALIDTQSKERTLDSNGVFSGKFKCEIDGKNLCEYEYRVDGDTLCITLFCSSVRKNALPVDEEGYSTIIIEAGSGITDVAYEYDGQLSPLSLSGD